jgi:hypothetical protein
MRETADLLLVSLRGRGAVVFLEALEVAPTQAELYHDLAEVAQLAAAMDEDNRRVRQAFVRAVVQDSGGVPAAIAGMLQAAGNDGEVTPASIRAYRHEAGTRYLDMTPALVLLVIGFMAMRYVSRGIGQVELLVMSGVGSALFYGLTFFLRRLGR